MADETMTPLRALTVAINEILQEDHAQGVEYTWRDPSPQGRAAVALDLARRIRGHLPAGWAVMDEAALHRELEAIDSSLREHQGAMHILLALRLQQDGHAQSFGDAMRLAEDHAALRRLYPQVLEDADAR